MGMKNSRVCENGMGWDGFVTRCYISDWVMGK